MKSLLFKDKDDLLLVLEDVLQMDNLGGLGADGEECNLVEHLCCAVHSAPHPATRNTFLHGSTDAVRLCGSASLLNKCSIELLHCCIK